MIHFHQVYCEFKSFCKVNFLCSFPKLVFGFLWKACLRSGERSSCWSIGGFSFSAVRPLHPARSLLEGSPGELPSQHLQITSRGKWDSLKLLGHVFMDIAQGVGVVSGPNHLKSS